MVVPYVIEDYFQFLDLLYTVITMFTRCAVKTTDDDWGMPFQKDFGRNNFCLVFTKFYIYDV